MITPKYHLFVCGGGKLMGDKKGLCCTRGGQDLARKLMDEIEDRELSGQVMLSVSSCFGVCDKGPVVAVYPEGVWYGNVSVGKVGELFDRHIEGGKPVESLMI
ncbi:MAG: (2Fe-2S) ferredoxin domain-containing protein [Planctomycetota bacterium]|jgi:(2Fe-2S) ferredoxin|nr:(2Fe-2S) ferredoxin domain-containing protein [Planctomycetota bacterium]